MTQIQILDLMTPRSDLPPDPPTAPTATLLPFFWPMTRRLWPRNHQIIRFRQCGRVNEQCTGGYIKRPDESQS